MLRYCDTSEILCMNLNYHQPGILRQRTGDLELKKYCVTLLEMFGSLKYTRHTLEKLDGEMRAEIAKLGGNAMLEDVLDELMDWKREQLSCTRKFEDFVFIMSNFSSFHGWLVANSYLFIFWFLKEEKILRNVCV